MIFLTLALSLIFVTADTMGIEIPLEQIWASQMPGTRDVKKLEGSLVSEIRHAIEHATLGGQETRAAFAVLGSKEEALRAAHSVFTGKSFSENSRRRITFPENSNVSVVFFSDQCANYVHLDRVEYQDKVINIYYRFVSEEPVRTLKPPQLALIPLGKLSSGKYRVNVIKSPLGQTPDGVMPSSSSVDTLRVIGSSFSFFVGQQLADQEPNQEGGEIYLDEIWGYGIPGSRPLKYGRWSSTGKHISEESPLVEAIVLSLGNIERSQKAKECFVVEGTGKQALRNAHAIFTKKGASIKQRWRPEQELSVVFFTHPTGPLIQLVKAFRLNRQIIVEYRIVLQLVSSGSTLHLAIIPLGKIPHGDYEIKLVRLPPVLWPPVPLPMEKEKSFEVPPFLKEQVDRMVCKSSRFSVKSSTTNKKPWPI